MRDREREERAGCVRCLKTFCSDEPERERERERIVAHYIRVQVDWPCCQRRRQRRRDEFLQSANFGLRKESDGERVRGAPGRREQKDPF